MAEDGEGDVQYSRCVKDPKTLKFFNDQVKNGEVVHTYKTFLELEIDGEKKLFPPMASRQVGPETGKLKMANAMVVGEWEESVGDPNSKNIFYEVNKNGEKVWKYRLKKEDTSRAVPAAYAPYQHSSHVVLNDQFEKASQRPNLDKHNTVIERTYALEKKTEVLEEKVKVANNRIADLESEKGK